MSEWTALNDHRDHTVVLCQWPCDCAKIACNDCDVVIDLVRFTCPCDHSRADDATVQIGSLTDVEYVPPTPSAE